MASISRTNDIQTNGTGSSSVEIDINTVIQALEVVHSPTSKNEHRHQATTYLEDLKSRPDTAAAGYELANDTTRQPLVRHYGLSLLEHVIKHQSFALNEQSSADLRQMVLTLSLTLPQTPQSFVRNKIAALWVELAKRSWALDWFDLDEILQQLWARSDTEKEFVLTVLENLSDDVFVREDATALLRDRDLNNSVVEIFISAENYPGGALKIAGLAVHARHGEKGWTSRVTEYLAEQLQSDLKDPVKRRACLASLGVLRSVFVWVMTPAIVKAQSMNHVCGAMVKSDTDVTLAALETLLAFYSRKGLEVVDVEALVLPICYEDCIRTLQQVYEWSIVGPDDVLDPRYTVSKKMAELAYHIANWLTTISPPDDLIPFFQYLIKIAKHDSLIVSIAAVHSWQKILEVSDEWRHAPAVQTCIQDVLTVAMERILAYDILPNPTERPEVIFVNEEIELHPERQGFYLNYRRLCFTIIEWISWAYLSDAAAFNLTAVDQGLSTVKSQEDQQDFQNYRRQSLSMIHADAFFSVVDATFRGIAKFTTSSAREANQENKIKGDHLISQAKAWTLNMLQRFKFQDPGTILRQMRTVVDISHKLLKSDAQFAFTVLEHIITTISTPLNTSSALVDAYSDLHQSAILEMRVMCTEHAAYFITFYDQLEIRLNQILESKIVDHRFEVDLKSVLLLLIEHGEGIDQSTRLEQMKPFIDPVQQQWRQHADILETFEAFLSSQALDQVGPLMVKINASQHHDWSQLPLPLEAEQIRHSMSDKAQRLPMRDSRILLSTSVEKISNSSSLQQLVSVLWTPMLKELAWNILRIINYSHRLHDPSSWPGLPAAEHGLIKRILRDRYWQSGISGGSMQDFHDRVKATKQTLEGFASSVRSRIRTNLENSYSILHNLGKLGSPFYGVPELPEAIATSLVGTASSLSPHHFGVLLAMLPKLLEECPRENMQAFLPPVMSELVRQIDQKCTTEWSKIATRTNPGQAENGDLSDEMREESVLRQMTARAVSMVTAWFDGAKETAKSRSSRVNRTLSFRSFVLQNPIILEPLLMFCSHAMLYQDTKTCATLIPALHKLVPAFADERYLKGDDAAAVREFISTEILRAAIGCLNEGYFADYHNNIAMLIALIWQSYGMPSRDGGQERSAWTNTPKNVLMSVYNMSPDLVMKAEQKIMQTMGKPKHVRAVVLELLTSVRGVRISEQGKYDTKQEKSVLLEKYKQRDALGMQVGENNQRGDEPDLGGVADMFG